MPEPVAFPLESCAATGVTFSRRLDEYLMVGRGCKLEVYTVQDDGHMLRFVTSHTFLSKPIYVGRHRGDFVIGFPDHVLVTDSFLQERRLYEVLPNEERVGDSRVLEYCGCGEVVVGFSSRNTLCFVHLGLQKCESVFFKAGRILSIASHGEYFALLASTQYLDPGNIFHSFKNLRSNYMSVFQVYGSRIAEVQKTTQLPFDAYKIVEAPQGFLVLAPRQMIFKRFKAADLRLRFSYLYEETDADGEALREFFEVFGQPINFDFSNLLKNKVYNYLNDNIQKEGELIHTIDDPNILRPPIQLMPGTPAPGHQEEMRYYGYDKREINIKYSQVINILGDFPTFDYTLEAELSQPQNIKYLGPRCGLQQFDQIPPLYNATVCFIAGLNQQEDETLMIFSQYGLAYSVQFTQQGPQMTPVLQADPDMSLWTQQQITCAEPLGSETQPQDFFDADDTASVGFNLFLGSAINDSYVTQFQLSTHCPGINFYTDYREKAGFGADDCFRRQLYEELQNACRLINIKQNQIIEDQSVKHDPMRTDELAGQQIHYRQSQYDSLFSQIPKPFEPSHVLNLTGRGSGLSYDDAEHWNSKIIAVLPSLAGVVDLQMQHRKHAGYIQNTAVQLHYAGVVERLQSQLQFDTPRILSGKSLQEQPQLKGVFPLWSDKDTSAVLVVKHSSSEVLKINTKNGDCVAIETPGLPTTVLHATYGNRVMALASLDAFYIFAEGARVPIKAPFQETALHAESCGDLWVATHQTGFSLSVLSAGQFSQPRHFACSEELHSTALFHRSVATAASLFGLDGSEHEFYVLAVTESSRLNLYGVSADYQEVEKLGSVYTLNQEAVARFMVSEPTDNEQEDSAGETEQKEAPAAAYPFCVSQAKVFNSNGLGVHLVLSTRGGMFLVYQAQEICGLFKLKLVKEPFGSPHAVPEGEDAFWCPVVAGRQQVQTLVGSPIQSIILQTNVPALFLGYPYPSPETTPQSYIVAPTLFGAVSFYALGRRPSQVRAGEHQKYLLQTSVPARYLVQLHQGDVLGIVDYDILTPRDLLVKPGLGRLFCAREISLGSLRSAVDGIPLARTQAALPGLPLALYLASLGQCSMNLYRQLLFLPFTASRLCFHSVTNAFLVVSSVARYEVRPTHSITRDEVANIRLFQMVEENESRMPKDDLIKLCRMIKPRDPAPYNSHSVLVHEHLWLIDQNQILDHQAIDLPRTEHVCCLSAEIMHSRYPGFYGKLWEGSYQPEDEYGRQDRRKKNDEAEKRQQILQEYKTVEESRELIVLGTGYLLGAFNKEYGKIYLFTVEQLSPAYNDQLQRQLKDVSPEKLIAFQNLQRQRVPHGTQKLTLNKVTSHEIQNATTAAVSVPQAGCLLVAEAKQIIGYLLVDGQKLEKCHQTPGFGFVSEIKKFQDFVFVQDAFHDSRMWCFRAKGRRLTEFAALSRQLRPVCSEFYISQYTQQMYLTAAIGIQRPCVGLYTYKTEAKQLAGHERLRITQIVDLGGLAPMKIVRIPTASPLPSTIDSGVSNIIITAEGAITSLVPVPKELFKLTQQETAVMPVRNLLVFFDRNQLLGKSLGKLQGVSELDTARIREHVDATRPAW